MLLWSGTLGSNLTVAGAPALYRRAEHLPARGEAQGLAARVSVVERAVHAGRGGRLLRARHADLGAALSRSDRTAGGTDMYKHILFPTDGSRRSRRRAIARGDRARQGDRRAESPACSSRRRRRPSSTSASFPSATCRPTSTPRSSQRAAARHLRRDREGRGHGAGVPCECVTVTGDFPAEAIVAEAGSGASATSSSWRRTAAPDCPALLLGSETQKVLHARPRCRCSSTANEVHAPPPAGGGANVSAKGQCRLPGSDA